MKTFINSKKDIQADTLCFCIQNKKDLKMLDFLELPTEILGDVEQTYAENTSCKKQYFLGKETYKNLIVFFLHESKKTKQELFFGKHFPQCPDELCLFASKEDTLLAFYEVCELSRYTFDVYKSEKKKRSTQVYIGEYSKELFCERKKIIDILFQVRDLGNTPSNDLTPEAFVNIISKTKYKNFQVKVLDEKDIKKKGFGLLDAVGKGSIHPPRLVILEYIHNKKLPTLALVGKGITFDTGGNQIKPGDYMYGMKADMGGAAVVYGISQILDEKKLTHNIVITLPLAENSVSGSAYKPSDIIQAYNKKTVEIIHTDAEGRLVLADALAYVEKKYSPQTCISVATLTGACVMALGYRYAGIMGNNEKLIQKFVAYGKNNIEAYVELPFDELFQEKAKSEIADYKNLDRATQAGASMGAAFLSQFLESTQNYIHIDIAGVYINEHEAYGRFPKTMTGFGVESISNIIENLQ